VGHRIGEQGPEPLGLGKRLAATRACAIQTPISSIPGLRQAVRAWSARSSAWLQSPRAIASSDRSNSAGTRTSWASVCLRISESALADFIQAGRIEP
jgi:hypothetical protein